MEIEIVGNENCRSFEVEVTMAEIVDAEDAKMIGRVHVGQIKILDEKSGKHTLFVINAKRNGNGSPVIEVTNIRANQGKITNCVGRMAVQ